MSIYRCPQCGTIAESTQAHGTNGICVQCQNSVQVYDTVFYVKSLLQRYFSTAKELKQLKENPLLAQTVSQLPEHKTPEKKSVEKEPEKTPADQTAAKPQLPAEIVEKIKGVFANSPKIPLNSLATQIKKAIPQFDQKQYGFKTKFSDFIRQCDFLVITGDKNNMMVSLKKAKTNAPNRQPENKPIQAKINLNDTDLFANQEAVEKIKQYLNNKNLTATFDYDAMDMSGYFDESSEIIGDHFALLEKYLKQIRYLYNNGKVGLTIHCADLPKNESQKLQDIFKQLFDYTIFAKYFYNSEDKKIRITLNTAESVKKFMCGGWLEWFAAIKLIKEVHGRGKKFAIARSVIVEHENGDKNEFDVVFMSEDQTPIFIECKSGEFRQHLDKFIRICKKISIPTRNWLVLASEIDQKQANAFEKMYPVSFCDLEHFVEKVKPMI